MDILETNLNVLKKRRPMLAGMVRQVRKSGNVTVEISKNNMPILKVKGILLHSSYDPEGEAAKTVSLFNHSESDSIIVLGFGMGYHLEELLKTGKKIIVAEPLIEVFRTAMEQRDLSELIDKIDIRVAEEPITLAVELAAADTTLFIHRSSERVNVEYFKRFSDAFISQTSKQIGALRILLVGPVYGGSLQTARHVAATLKEMGHEVEFVDCSIYADSYFKINGITKNNNYEAIIRNKYIDFLGEMIIAKAADFIPDIILAMAQAPMSVNVIDRLKQSNTPIAFWFVEDFRTLSYWKEVAVHYDYFFCIQRGEFFDLLARSGVKNYYYLPQACYPPVHNKKTLSPDEIAQYGSNISFVGAGYYNRQIFLKGITDFDFKIWGSEWPLNLPLGPFIQEKARRLSPEEYVRVFNGTSVNINLHSSTYHVGIDPAGDFVNPRTFELASCGAFQLVDFRSELGELFDIGSEIICYDNLADLREKIHYYIEHPIEREQISDRGRTRALSDHTFKARLKILLGIITVNDHERISARIEDRKKVSREKVNNIGYMIKEAGEGTELGCFLNAFNKEDSLIPERVMKKIEEGSGSISRVEAIFMMINEILMKQK